MLVQKSKNNCFCLVFCALAVQAKATPIENPNDINATGRFNASEVRSAVSVTCDGDMWQYRLSSNKSYSSHIAMKENLQINNFWWSGFVFKDLTSNPQPAVDTVLFTSTTPCPSDLANLTTTATFYNFEAHYWPDYYLNEHSANANVAVLTPCTPVANAKTVSCSNFDDTIATCLLSGYEQLMPGAACTLSSDYDLPDSSGLGVGAIVGIVCGAILFLVVLEYATGVFGKIKNYFTNTINEEGTAQVFL